MNGDGDSADDLLKDSPRGVEHADTGFKDNTVIAHSTGINLSHNTNDVLFNMYANKQLLFTMSVFVTFL